MCLCASVPEDEVSNACAGDDSTWKAADWHWDSRAFVAAPKDGLQDTSNCCKKRKTESLTGFPGTFPGSCGGCRAAELAPLNFLQQTDNSTGSSRSANDLLGSSFPKVGWLLLYFSLNMALTNLSHWSRVLLIDALIAFEKPVGLMLCQQVWPGVAVWSMVCQCLR